MMSVARGREDTWCRSPLCGAVLHFRTEVSKAWDDEEEGMGGTRELVW